MAPARGGSGGSEVLVEATGLVRCYGRRTVLAELSLSLRRGEILALVGPNGCGKTTLMRLMAGFVRPTGGRIRVFGLEPFSHRREVMRRSHFAFAPPALYETLSAEEHLRYLGGLGSDAPGRGEIDQKLELVGLADRARDRVGTYSFGMRQRLSLALALIPTPELLVLDEPNEGLDPLAVIELREVLAGLREQLGLSLVLSSHLLSEVDKLVDRLLVLQEGRMLFVGSPDELRGSQRQTCVVPDDLQAGRRTLAGRGVDAEEDEGELVWSGDQQSLEEVQAWFRAEGQVLHSFRHRQPRLEQALLALLRSQPGALREPASGEES